MWAVDFPGMIKADLQVRHLSKKQGVTAGTVHFRFYEPAAELLLRFAANEWRATRRSGSYVWLTPLNVHLVDTVRVEIPEPHEIERAAAELHGIGEPFVGTLFNWPCRYRPRQSGRLPVVSMDRVEPARFELGVEGVWFVICTWMSERAKHCCLWVDDAQVVTNNEA